MAKYYSEEQIKRKKENALLNIFGVGGFRKFIGLPGTRDLTLVDIANELVDKYKLIRSEAKSEAKKLVELYTEDEERVEGMKCALGLNDKVISADYILRYNNYVLIKVGNPIKEGEFAYRMVVI